MLRGRCAFAFAGCLALTSGSWAAGPALVVNRGLPEANLNNVSGASRSNVRWASGDTGFMGDHFTIGAPGEKWVIDSIRTWAVPGLSEVDPDHLGDFYEDVRLYFGSSGGDLTPAVSASLSEGSDQTSNPNVQISEATKSGTALYDNFGKFLRVWQVDFTNLNLPVDGGASYGFGVWGMGREIPAGDGKSSDGKSSGGNSYMWFNHASNAALSGAEEDGANGVMLVFDASGKSGGEFTAQGHGWDKNSNINVQVFAHRVTGAQQ